MGPATRMFIFTRRVGFRFAAVLISLLAVACRGQDGIQLFHKMQSALGGRDKIAAITDFEQCVRADAWDDEGKAHGEVYKRTRWIRPNVLRLDQVGPGNSYVLFFYGVAGWEVLPGKGFLQLAGDELDFARGYLSGLDLNFWLSDGNANNLFAASARNVVTISTKDDESHKTEITLNPETFLPEKEVLVSMNDRSHSVVTKTRQFQEWEAFQGVRFPRRIINFHGDQKVADIRVEEIRLDSGIKTEDLARKPNGLSPEMSRCGR
jgi:hypothetical protein